MIRTILKKSLSAVLALWAVWQLGILGKDLRSAIALENQLRQQISDARQKLEELEQPRDISDQLKAMGYVYRGDIVFFDGG